MTNAGDTISALGGICAALAIPATTAQLDLLSRYLDALQQWNATYNLTAVRERDAMLTQHLADCLAIVGPVQRRLADHPAPRVLDVGSGGGLPGVVIAIMAPGLHVACVDAVAKKMAFVRQVAGTLGLRNLQVQHARVEQLAVPPFELITSRAFASLSDFVSLTEAHLASGGVWVAMKGRRPTVEIAEMPATIQMFHVEQLSVPGLDADRCLVWMRRCHEASIPSHPKD